jgi:Mycothiol maleylpyruvate isomerase N-terminal domain.
MAAASAEAARVVGNVPQNALDTPTPCGDWDLRTLLNHTILWTSYSAERRAHGESVAEDLMNKDFTADPGFREDYARQIGKAVQAWSAPEAWAGTAKRHGRRHPGRRRGRDAAHGNGPARLGRGQGHRPGVQDRRANGQSPRGHRPGPGRTLPQVPGLRRRRRTTERTRRPSSAPSPCPAATPAGSQRHNDAVSTRTGEP